MMTAVRIAETITSLAELERIDAHVKAMIPILTS